MLRSERASEGLRLVRAEGGSVTARSKDEPKAGNADHNGGSSVQADGHDQVETSKSDEAAAAESPEENDHSRKDQASKGGKQKKRGLKGVVAELEEALAKAEREAAENYDQWLRARAEYDNLRKRTRRDVQQVHLRAGEDLVRRLLPALDNLEKAIEACRESDELKAMEEGLLLIQKGLMEPLKANGVEAIAPLGDRFDPSFHEAMMQLQTDDAEPGTVVQVLQTGYLMNGVTLRPAKVVVAGAVEEAGEGDSAEGNSKTDGANAHDPGDRGEPSGEGV
jgi:molecular chaperone GrpE